MRRCHLGFNAGMHPRASPGLAEDSEDQRLQRLPRRGRQDVPAVIPREPRVTRYTCKSAALRRLPRSANVVPPGTNTFRKQSMASAPSATPHRDDVSQQLPRQGVRARRREDRRLLRLPRRPQILPASDPASTVSEEDLVKICAKCIPEPTRLRRLQGARQSAGPTLVIRDLVLLDRLVLLIAVVFSFAFMHTSLYIYRGWKEGLYSRAHPPRAGPQGTDARRIAASTSSTAGSTSSSSSVSPCSCSRACRSSTRTPAGRSGSWTCSAV